MVVRAHVPAEAKPPEALPDAEPGDFYIFALPAQTYRLLEEEANRRGCTFKDVLMQAIRDFVVPRGEGE